MWVKQRKPPEAYKNVSPLEGKKRKVKMTDLRIGHRKQKLVNSRQPKMVDNKIQETTCEIKINF